ncbi:MAG: serine hydrolase [Chitinophagales bacterium]
MKKKFITIAKVIQFTVLFCTGIQMAGFAQGFSPTTKARLQSIIDSFQNDPANPYVGGMSAAIRVDGLAFWQGATGYAARNVDGQNNLLPGGSPFTTSVLSRMYSVTKTFTAALVLELAKQGAFRLEDRVSNFLPMNLINPELNGAVTIRQLLAHESGYSEYTDEMQLQIAVAFQPTHSWTVPEILSFIHQVAIPGAERRYSSTNYILLGAIVEITTRKSVEQHFRQRFFTPLQLRSMFLGEREPLWNGATLASPHDNISPFNPIFQLTGQPTFPDAYTNISAFPFTSIVSLAFTGGGIVTNVADMAEWGNALYGGRATSHSVLHTMLNSISSTPDEDGDFLGYGIIRSTKISSTDVFIGHDGNGPGYRSVMFYQPDKKMTIAILTNYHGAKLYDVAKALYESLPDFTCDYRNKKDDKIQVCFNGHSLCLPRPAATLIIRFGAYLGGCDRRPDTRSEEVINVKNNKFIPEKPTITAYPNPFNDRITLTFKLTKPGKVNLAIYDINGKLIATVYNGFAEKGILQKVDFTTAKLPAGIYFSRLQTPDGVFQQKLTLVR